VSELTLILVLVIAGGVFAGAEIAVVAVRLSRLKELVDEGRRGARAVLALREAPERFLATVQVGITVIASTASVFGGASLALHLTPVLEGIPGLSGHAHDAALVLVVTGISFLSIVIGELVPKSLALRSAEPYALWIGKPLLTLSWLARPIVWLLSSSANLLLKPFGDSTTFTETRHSVEELQQLVEEAAKTGTLHPEAGEIASRALDLPDLRVSDVMVPRQQAVLLEKSTPLKALRPILREQPHSRMPVYDGSIDNVVGYVNVKDLLQAALEEQPRALAELMRPPHFVPETQRAVDLLRDMRQQRMKFAIVVDEVGGIAGIVTLEDLVEELVGDIFSEHSRPAPPPIRNQADGSVLVSGALPVREVNRVLGFELPDDGDWNTIGGLSMALAGHVPSAGETLALDNGFTLEMVDVSPRRVRSVRIKPPEQPPEAKD
jgi:putative hemolysin